MAEENGAGAQAGTGSLPDAIEMTALDPLRLAFFDLSDHGNAMRLVARVADRLLWDPAQGWVAWNGRHWDTTLGDALALKEAHLTGQAIALEASALEALAKKQREKGEGAKAEVAEERVKALYAWGVRSGDSGKTTAMLAQAKPYLLATGDDFDREALQLNCANRVVRMIRADADAWDTSDRAHDPALRLSKMTLAAWNPDAVATEWLAHLETVLPDPVFRHHFHKWMGYCCTAGNREQRILLLQGKGGDGKSTCMNVIRRVLGSYAVACDVKTFLEGGNRSGADASPDIARLGSDVRLCSTGEPPLRARLNEGLIKSITGGSPILARFLNRDPFEYVPRFKLVIEVNAKPSIGGADDGIWRRIDLIKFPVQIPKDQMDRGLEDRIVANEADGVLAWLMEGLALYLLEGLHQPAEVEELVREYRATSNPFVEWLGERVEQVPGASEGAKALYTDYQMWCQANEYEAKSQRAFGLMMSDRQISVFKDSRGNKARRDVRLRPRPPEWADQTFDLEPQKGGRR